MGPKKDAAQKAAKVRFDGAAKDDGGITETISHGRNRKDHQGKPGRVLLSTSANVEGSGDLQSGFSPYCIDAVGFDDDPVEKEWAVCMNPGSHNRHTVVLRYPHRNSGNPYLDRNSQQPLEIRIKPKSGLVEVDIPLPVHQKTYDRHRGIQYGEAMGKNGVIQSGGSFGVRGGLGNANFNGRRFTGSQGFPSTTETLQDDPLRFDEDSGGEGRVMNKITMAGIISPWEETDPLYFLATFKENVAGGGGQTENYVFLTKVEAIVELNPVLDHVDAMKDNEKVVTSRAAQGRTDEAGEGEARAVNMTVKATDEEGEEMETLGERSEIIKAINRMREEPWQRLEYHDSETREAWDQYAGTLTQRAPKTLPRLVSSLSNEQWIDAISAPRGDISHTNDRKMSLPRKTRSTRRGLNRHQSQASSSEQNGEMLDDTDEDGEETQARATTEESNDG